MLELGFTSSKSLLHQIRTGLFFLLCSRALLSDDRWAMTDTVTETSLAIAIVVQGEQVARCRSWTWTGSAAALRRTETDGGADGAGGARDSYKSLCKNKIKYSARLGLYTFSKSRNCARSLRRSRARRWLAISVRARGDGGTRKGCASSPCARRLHGSLALLPFACNILYAHRAGRHKMRQKAFQTSYGSTPMWQLFYIWRCVATRGAAILQGASGEQSSSKPIPCVSSLEKRITSCTAFFFKWEPQLPIWCLGCILVFMGENNSLLKLKGTAVYRT